MTSTTELLREGRTREIWERYCGHLDLSLEQFTEIQERLLLEQIGLLSKCELGRRIMGEHTPASVEEFRRKVPLTAYRQIQPYLA